jgi:hypothetical protein
MALGKTNQNDGSKLLVLRIKNKTKDMATGKEIPLMPNLFEISEKIDGKWKVRPEMESRVAGDLTKIEFSKDEYEGTPYKILKLFLTDKEAGETYLIDARYTKNSRDLMNAILSLESYENLSISLYKKEGKDKKEYSNIALWQGSNLIKGKYSLAEIPPPEEIKDSKGNLVMRKFDEIDEWFEGKLKGIAKNINGKAKKLPNPSDDAQEDMDNNPADSKVPF